MNLWCQAFIRLQLMDGMEWIFNIEAFLWSMLDSKWLMKSWLWLHNIPHNYKLYQQLSMIMSIKSFTLTNHAKWRTVKENTWILLQSLQSNCINPIFQHTGQLYSIMSPIFINSLMQEGISSKPNWGLYPHRALNQMSSRENSTGMSLWGNSKIITMNSHLAKVVGQKE